MKHFHINDEKKRLATKIFNLTQYLETCYKERTEILARIELDGLSYTQVQVLQNRLARIRKDLQNTDKQIDLLQEQLNKLP